MIDSILDSGQVGRRFTLLRFEGLRKGDCRGSNRIKLRSDWFYTRVKTDVDLFWYDMNLCRSSQIPCDYPLRSLMSRNEFSVT